LDKRGGIEVLDVSGRAREMDWMKDIREKKQWLIELLHSLALWQPSSSSTSNPSTGSRSAPSSATAAAVPSATLASSSTSTNLKYAGAPTAVFPT